MKYTRYVCSANNLTREDVKLAIVLDHILAAGYRIEVGYQRVTAISAITGKTLTDTCADFDEAVMRLGQRLGIFVVEEAP